MAVSGGRIYLKPALGVCTTRCTAGLLLSWALLVRMLQFLTTNNTEVDVEMSDEESSFPIHQHPQWELVGNKAKATIST